MTRYWISWVEPSEDYRPMSYPPNESVLGWWCSGYDEKERAMICACVQADSQSAARDAVLKDWPEAGNIEWRFCDAKGPKFIPGDRFPLMDWMKPRFERRAT